MYIDMTGQAVGEHFQLALVVWFTVAIGTGRDFAMFLMTHDTFNLAVLARCTLPLAVNILMAAAADLHIDRARERDP